MRTVLLAAGSKEKRPGTVNGAAFLPLAAQNVNVFVGQGMRMGRHGRAGVKFSQGDEAPGRGILVQHHQFNPRVWARLPFAVLRQRNVLEHGRIERAADPDGKTCKNRFSSPVSPVSSRERRMGWPMKNAPAPVGTTVCRG